jgi:hypothetical protein
MNKTFEKFWYFSNSCPFFYVIKVFTIIIQSLYYRSEVPKLWNASRSQVLAKDDVEE